jgi:hypothetical protein
MPNRVPDKPRAKSIRAGDLHPELRPPKRRHVSAVETFDWLALWALSIGFSAIVLAALVFYGGGDSTGASMILFGAAIVIAIVLYGSATFDKPR